MFTTIGENPILTAISQKFGQKYVKKYSTSKFEKTHLWLIPGQGSPLLLQTPFYFATKSKNKIEIQPHFQAIFCWIFYCVAE